MKTRPRRPLKPAPRPRSWWTRERVLAGLRRFLRDTGEMPTGAKAYHRRVLIFDRGRTGALRLYPPFGAVLKYWPSFVAAWKDAGSESHPAFRPRIAPLPEEAGSCFATRRVRNRTGERHGRLVVERLVGFKRRAGYWSALWRCRCDCGNTREVEAGRIEVSLCCLECAAKARRDGLAAAVKRGIPRSATGQYQRRRPQTS